MAMAEWNTNITVQLVAYCMQFKKRPYFSQFDPSFLLRSNLHLAQLASKGALAERNVNRTE